MSYIEEDATKTIWNKLERQTKICFQTELCLENGFFVQNLQENLF